MLIDEFKERKLERIARELTPQEVGYLMYLCRRKYHKKCAECGTEFIGHESQLYCSKKCKNRVAKRNRRRREREKKIGG